MKLEFESKLLGWLVLASGLVAGIIILPGISQDPINLPKMIVIVVAGLSIFGLLVANPRRYINSGSKIFSIFLLLFLTQISLVLLFADSPFSEQLYGTNGRNTGFLAYLGLVLLAFGANIAANKELIKSTTYLLVGMGFVSAAYGLLQTIGSDPVKWNNPYNSVITFLGNPNFASSFLGICAVVTFAIALGEKISKIQRIVFALQVVLLVVLTMRSRSQQGTLVFLSGAALVFFFFLKSKPKFSKIIVNSYLLLVGLLGTFAVLGMLNTGPLSEYLYKLSVRQRGYYWHAAKDMMFSQPIFGVGLDSYDNWYLLKRSANAAFNTPDTQSNSAHNIFLDLGASGGIPLFAINLFLSAMAFRAIYRLLRRSSSYDWSIAAISGAWVAYEAQAVISINQLGVGVWGWILMGLLVGFEYKDRQPNINVSSQQITYKIDKRKVVSTNSIVGISLGAIIGSSLVFPAMRNDIEFRKATTIPDAQNLINKATAQPMDLNRTLLAANLLASSNLVEPSINLIDLVISKNPRNYNAWKLKYTLTAPDSTDNEIARQNLRKLNPYFEEK
jgi:O-antigen ligase